MILEDIDGLLTFLFKSNRTEAVLNVPLSKLVRNGCEFKIVPLDLNNSLHRECVEIITERLNEFYDRWKYTGGRFMKKRPNEVGSNIEPEITYILNRPPLFVTQLKRKGYPDIEIRYKNIFFYLEVKTFVGEEKSSFRDFYISNFDKIKNDAVHLILVNITSDERPQYYKLERWHMADLSSFTLSLKMEWNATKTDVLNLVITNRT